MALLLFVVAIIVGLLMLSGALVVWLAEMAVPLHGALLIVGLLYMVVAVVVYCCSLRSWVLRWRQRLDIVYEVSATFDLLYRRVAVILKKLVGDLL